MNISLGDFETTEKMRDYIDDILDSGWISYGKYSRRFEQEFANLHGCSYGVLSNSGTSSLLVALQTLKELHGWQDGDEVLVPAITFVATVNIVLHLRLKPVLVDIEVDYYGIDAEKILTAITDKTRCIIPVHTFGQPCDMNTVDRESLFNGLSVIEDSCETMFSRHRGRPVGSYGDIACFSTYMAHLLTTGVGGIATTSNPDYAKTMRSLVNHGLAYDDLSEGDNFNPSRLSRDFRFDRIGHSFRITEFEAALGLAQLETWKTMIKKRQENAEYLTEGLQDFFYHLQLPKVRPNTDHAYMMYPIVCQKHGVRDALCSYLNERGIGTRRMLPLLSQPCYKGLWTPDDYPIAQWIDDNGYYIGSHPHLTQDQLDYVIEAHYDFFKDKPANKSAWAVQPQGIG